MTDDLLPVGRFARLADLTVHALRHYDAVGLLTPADVDPDTGYRRYAPGQVAEARMIRDLRWLSVPLPVVREILVDPQGDRARALLDEHAERLQRERDHLDRQLDQCTRYATRGVTVPTVPSSTAPVQLKITVADKERARRFYEEAFGLAERVIRHTDDADYLGYQFGDHGQPGFFLLVLLDPSDFDSSGRSTFGVLVPDLDAVHRRALDAGAEEAVPVRDPDGMPRTSAVTDPDGNFIWLYQG